MGMSSRRQGEEPKQKRSGSSVLLIMLIVIAVHVGITAWAATTRNGVYAAANNTALSTLLLAFIIMLWCPPFNILGIVGCLVMILLSSQILNKSD